MSLKQFFDQHRPEALTVDILAAEIARLEAKAADLEYHNWNDTAAPALLRSDAKGLCSIKSRLIAEQSPVREYNSADDHERGDIVRALGALWQRRKGKGLDGGPGRSDWWECVSGTPTAAQPAQATMKTMDFEIDLTKDMPRSTAAERENYDFLKTVEDDCREHIAGMKYDEEDLTRPITLRFQIIMEKALIAKMRMGIEQRDKAIEALTKRVEELEAGGVRYLGNHQRAATYRKGDMVTAAGSAWIALKAVPDGAVPGTSPDHWQLAVKAGKDARPS